MNGNSTDEMELAEGNPRIAGGVKHEQDSWGDTYTASKAALIAAGCAQDGQFPGDPGRGSTSCSYTENGEPVRRGRAVREKVLSITRYGKLFKVWAAVDKQERERRRAAEVQAAEWRKKAAEADAEIKSEADKLAELPATGEDYAERAAQLFWASFHVFWNRYGGSKPDASGYSFTPEDREIILALADRMYWELHEAQPRFDGQARMRKLTEARVRAAKADYPLQRLIDSATTGRANTAKC